MKRILGIATALAVVGVAAAQSTGSLDFDVNVAGITAIAVDSIGGSGGIEELNISYDLNSAPTFDFTGESGFQLRYITNRTGPDATISQDNCEFAPELPGDIACGDPNTAWAGQFESAYITVAAGALDDENNLVAVDAFEDALSLNLQTDSCDVTALANDFTVPPGFGAYDVTDPERGVIASYDAVDFTALEKARAQASLGASQADDGLTVAFDGVAVDLIGKSGDEETQIRGAACGPTPGTGMDVTVSPVINTSKLLPEGRTEVTLVLTIHQTTDD